MKKLFIAVLILLALLIGAFFVLNSYIYNEKQADTDGTQQASIEGEYVCLPAKDPSIALNECAAGVLVNGQYFAIDLGLMSQGAPAMTEGDRFTANGIVTPIENLSTDYWERFPVVGIFSVTDSLQVLQPEEEAQPMVYRGMLPCASCAGIDTTLSLTANDDSGRFGTYELVEVYQDDEPLTVTTGGSWQIEETDGESFFVLMDVNAEGDTYRYRIDSPVSIRFAGQDGSALDSDLPYDLILSNEETQGNGIFNRQWVWMYTDHMDGSRIEAPSGGAFVLSFSSDGRYTSTTDCNNIAGDFVIDGEVLSLGAALSTKMFCEGSLENVYTNDLLLTNSYVLEGTTLRLNLNRDYGVMYFEAR
jgi:heat shock protein HslJ